jgi:hypothetical protein
VGADHVPRQPPPLVRLVLARDPAAVAALVRAWRANVWSGLDEIGGLVMVPLAALALRSRGWPAVAAATGLAGFALTAVMPADWMPGARFALPSMILLVAAAGWSAHAIVSVLSVGRRRATFALTTLMALWLARSHETLLAYEIGAVGYYSGLRGRRCSRWSRRPRPDATCSCAGVAPRRRTRPCEPPRPCGRRPLEHALLAAGPYFALNARFWKSATSIASESG